MIELKKLNPNLHATKKYLSWLKESDVKRFTDIKYQKFSIKKFKESAEEDLIVKKTTKREIKMLNVLKDKSVVKMLEAFKRKGRLYLVFEFMDKNLLEVLEEKPDGLDREVVKFFIY